MLKTKKRFGKQMQRTHCLLCRFFFERVTSWPLIRQTQAQRNIYPASDSQLQIEISWMKRKSPQSFIFTISIHLPPTWVLNPTNPNNLYKNLTRSAEKSSGSHLTESFSQSLAMSQAKRKLRPWGTGHFFRNFLPRMIGSTGGEMFISYLLYIYVSLCVCVCVQYSIYDTGESRILSRMMNCYYSIISTPNATMLHLLVPPLTHREFAGPILDSCNHQLIERNTRNYPFEQDVGCQWKSESLPVSSGHCSWEDHFNWSISKNIRVESRALFSDPPGPHAASPFWNFVDPASHGGW